ncbi:MAG: heme lyase CcmF/NrfE family subunit [Gammaproteobacteria bacterium]|nr:heme lyase CcmF/NrfE family subunit [Gammaproteobacteria bacterium]
MLPELGHFAMILALLLACMQSFYGLVGAHKNDRLWMSMAGSSVYGQLLLALFAIAVLSNAFLTNDFSLLYVAQNSNSALPKPYRFAAVWGAHEGSLLLWIVILAIWSTAVAWFSKSLPPAFRARTLGVLGLVSIGFYLFTLLTSNPFDRLVPPAVDGRDLNPILQDPALVMHPPMLYVGYVGFSVAFAFALAALLGKEKNTDWARWARPWTTVAWLFLTVGIALGSWWAYYELGWGGWWFWDPVENASFMPWLAGTALIHSLAVTEKRGAFTSWTLLLAIAAFSLSLLGTFLVRSGVLVSVHAFATDPARGVFILLFLGIVVGGALSIYAWRAPQLDPGKAFKPLSRETFLLINNVLLIVATGAVLLGTLYPLFLDALNLGKISVGPPYFNAVFIPLMLALLLALGVGPYVRWKKDQGADIFQRIKAAAGITVVAAILITLLTSSATYIMGIVGVLFGTWALVTAVQEPWQRWRANHSLPNAVLGMSAAHFGVGILTLGITVTSILGIEQDIALKPGESATVSGYTFSFGGTQPIQGPNYEGVEGRFEVFKDDKRIATLYPQKRVYNVQRNPMTEAAIDPGLFRDLYVSLGETLGAGAWSVRLQYKPLVRFIWLGALIMAFGGVLAATDRRYRRVTADAEDTAREGLARESG